MRKEKGPVFYHLTPTPGGCVDFLLVALILPLLEGEDARTTIRDREKSTPSGRREGRIESIGRL
jgi:hypothetical protein